MLDIAVKCHIRQSGLSLKRSSCLGKEVCSWRKTCLGTRGIAARAAMHDCQCMHLPIAEDLGSECAVTVPKSHVQTQISEISGLHHFGPDFPLIGQQGHTLPVRPSDLLALVLVFLSGASYVSVSKMVFVMWLDLCLGKHTPQLGLKTCTLLLQAVCAPPSFACFAFDCPCPAELDDSPSAKPSRRAVRQ